METKKMDDQRGSWTNERHMDYLSSMEASFVRTMLENSCGGGGLLRLDRYLPDSSESTLDLKKERGRRHSTSDIQHRSNRTDRKTRRRSSDAHPYTSSQDQVVPQLENGAVDDNEARGHPSAAVSSTAPAK